MHNMADQSAVRERPMRDGIAPWFHARKPLGIAHEGSFAVLQPTAEKVSWLPYSHTDVDGYAAMIRLFDHYGIRHYRPPRHNRAAPPGIRRVFSALASAPAAARIPPRWRSTASAAAVAQSPPAWRLFSEAETAALQASARRQRVWITSLLLGALHRVVAQSLLLSDGGGWLFPVNLRGAYPEAREDAGNYVGGFYVQLPAMASAARVQAEVRAGLRAMRHWWSWYQARLAAFLPQSLINLIYRRMLQRNHYLGSFSFGGDWQVDFAAAGLPADSALLACAPGSPNHPVANGMIICNGRLSLALRLDPVLGVDQQGQQQLLDAWCNELLAGMATARPDTAEADRAAVNL